MAQLSHPNLVNVYDFSASGGEVFLVMELITGGTLRELLAERGPMPPHAAAAVMRGMLTGLAVAHEKGMVHRDIKPDNVLIDASSRVKLSDFGLVRAAAETTQSTDQIVGTVAYLSPEQVDGSPTTAASDVYSAGIVLFELLTGQTPFDGDTPPAHAYARLRSDVPISSLRSTTCPASCAYPPTRCLRPETRPRTVPPNIRRISGSPLLTLRFPQRKLPRLSPVSVCFRATTPQRACPRLPPPATSGLLLRRRCRRPWWRRKHRWSGCRRPHLSDPPSARCRIVPRSAWPSTRCWPSASSWPSGWARGGLARGCTAKSPRSSSPCSKAP